MTTREALAYHEAGHAVAGVLTGYPFSYVTIVTDENYQGHIKLSGIPLLMLIKHINSRKSHIVTLARGFAISLHGGNVAEEIFLGHRSDSESWTDIRDIETIAGYRSKHPKVWAQRLRRQTYNMLVDPVVWRDVVIVATALLEKQTLTGEEVHVLIKRDYTWGPHYQLLDKIRNELTPSDTEE